MRLQGEISQAILEQYVGQRLEILVDAPQGEWPGLHLGRTWFQAPEIDGHTYISGPGVAPGALLQADIVESATYDLTALAG
jgi:tRNA-2-methylthio-N6-dimethylallyladenosine synthase/ribosomal protein S12 methylthiotransferase